VLKSEKEEVIKELTEKFQRAQTAIVAEFSKLDVETVTKLRRKFREGPGTRAANGRPGA
jgi:large subunit ribosomal protein L10